MKKNRTKQVSALDRSGIIRRQEEDAPGGFSDVIEKQKKTEGEAVTDVHQEGNDHPEWVESCGGIPIPPLVKKRMR